MLSKLDQARASFDLKSYIEQFYVLIPSMKTGQYHLDCPKCDDGRARFYVWLGQPTRYNHRPENGRKVFWCHNCTWAPNLEEFISFIEDISLREAMVLLRKEAQEASLEEQVADLGTEDASNAELPPLVIAPHVPVRWPNQSALLSDPSGRLGYYRKYLARRRFTAQHARRYGLRGCWHGQYQGRLLLPVYEEERLVGWVARDATGKKERKVLNGPDGVATSEMLFNGDAVRRALKQFGAGGVRVRLVEGAFDAMRADREETGEPAVAPLGTHLSAYIIKLLSEMGVQKLCLLWDADTWESEQGRRPKAEKAIERLKPRFDLTAVRLPDSTDPDDHTEVGLDRMVEGAFNCGGFDLFASGMESKMQGW